jgi:hypothetical protein
MHIDEARHDREVAPIVYARRGGNLNFIRAAHGDDFVSFYENDGIGNFIARSKSTSSENRQQGHEGSSYWNAARVRQRWVWSFERNWSSRNERRKPGAGECETLTPTTKQKEDLPTRDPPLCGFI